MLSRRELLKVGASAAAGALLGACGSSDGGTTTSTNGTTPPPMACDGAGATSTTVRGHTHDVCIPASALAMPAPEGATFETSVANGHAHAVVMTEAQLMAIAGGELVSMLSTVTQGHAHDFSLERAPQPPTPLPQPGGPYD